MRNQTLAFVISSMLMAAASQAQSAPTDVNSGNTASQSQTESSGTTSTTGSDATASSTDMGTSTTTSGAGTSTTATSPDSSSEGESSYDADQSNNSDASAMAQQRWREADTDRNGSLSQAEIQASMPTIAANFSTMDANGDGQVSKDEMHNVKHSDTDGKWSQDFKSADTDRNGSLSLAEAQNGAPTVAPHFSTIDADKDGKLTRDEMAAHHRSMKSNSSDASMDADSSTRKSTSTTTTTTTESDKAETSGTSNH